MKSSSNEYKQLIDGMNDTAFVIDFNGKFLEVNDTAVRNLGYSREELLTMGPVDIDPHLSGNEIGKLIEGMRSDKKQVFETEHRTKKGKIIPVEISSSPVTYQGKPAILSVARDITERKKTEAKLKKEIEERKRVEEALSESEERFRGIFENATIGLYRTTPEGQILIANPTLVRMLGYSSFKELKMRDLNKEGYEPDFPRSEFQKRIESEGEVIGLESAWTKKDGPTIYVRESARAIRDKTGKILYYEGTVEDITERKIAEQQIQRDLKEKTMLLTEIHHRVKNSLQLVSSLLHLQALKITDEHILDLFNQNRNRIFMMARVYEKLYRSENFSVIDYKEYLEDVLNQLYQSSGLSQRVSLKLDVKNVILGLDDAIPTALIVNELFTNSIKHAFPGDRKGRIEVSFHMLDEETYELVYRDNGVGLPAGVDFDSTEVLGLNLVKDLAHQIQGAATLKSNDWTTFRITFKGYEYLKKKT
jgi:PAS domain S-box-containing protein